MSFAEPCWLGFTLFCGGQMPLRFASTTLYSINSQFKAAYCRINIFNKSLSLNFFNWIAIALMAYGFGFSRRSFAKRSEASQ